jgi:hypothetical protein
MKLMINDAKDHHLDHHHHSNMLVILIQLFSAFRCSQ